MNFEPDILFSPWTLGLLGLVVGSFLNVVIHRLPLMTERKWLREGADMLTDPKELARASALGAEEANRITAGNQALVEQLDKLPPLSLCKPRSRCPECGHGIAWYHNIPVLGWLMLRGKCAHCSEKISMRYPFIELLTGALFAGAALKFGAQPQALLWCGFLAALLAMAAIDWDTTFLFDSQTQPLLWAGLLAAWAGWTLPLETALIGAAAGYLSLWSVYWLFKLTTGREGMGYGDFKLLALLGAWLGWKMLLPILIAASVVGILAAIVMKATSGLREGRYVPFGPFLAAGGVAVLFLGAQRVYAFLGW